MIARLWRGTTRIEDAERYQAYLNETGVPDYRSTLGNRGVFVLQRVHGAVAEFLLVTLWDSMDAIREFAGPDVERAVYYPEDAKFLLSIEPTVVHYDLVQTAGLAGVLATTEVQTR